MAKVFLLHITLEYSHYEMRYFLGEKYLVILYFHHLNFPVSKPN